MSEVGHFSSYYIFTPKTEVSLNLELKKKKKLLYGILSNSLWCNLRMLRNVNRLILMDMLLMLIHNKRNECVHKKGQESHGSGLDYAYYKTKKADKTFQTWLKFRRNPHCTIV